jgi:histidine triad (HIT) family protein
VAQQSAECIFCKIIAGELPCRKIYEDEKALGILDINPRFSPGQCLVIPKKHAERFYDLENDEIAELFKAVKIVAKKLEKVFAPPRYRICMLTSGRAVPHTHVFLFPSSSSLKSAVFEGFIEIIEANIRIMREWSDDKLDAMLERIEGGIPIGDVGGTTG